MKQGFDKKIFTARLFLSDIGFLFWNIPKIIGANSDKKINKVFTEKIMTVTTAVNGCTYCTWFHAKQAVNSGISEEEVRNAMKQFGNYSLTTTKYKRFKADKTENRNHKATETVEFLHILEKN